MGKTVDAALANAASAAVAWAAVARADDAAIPKPRPLEALRSDPAVAAELRAGGALVTNVSSLDAGLLQAIDDAATAHGLTRSSFLASAARDKILAEGMSRREPRSTGKREGPAGRAAGLPTIRRNIVRNMGRGGGTP